MNGGVRLFISDIDGTLIRPDKSLSESVVAAARRLQAAGVKMTLISARPVSGMVEFARRLGVTGPIGAYNGGTIAHADGTLISAERLSLEAATQAMRLLDEPGITLWAFADGLWHTTDTTNPHTSSERITAAQEPVVVADLTPFLDRIDKLVAVSDDEPRLAALEASTARALGDHAAVARSQRYYLDVTAPSANKGAGVTALAEAFGVPLAQTAVIGDGRNDMRMFAVAGFSVAVANASDEVRAAADAVTASNAEDGVAQAIDRLILPMTGASA